MNIYKYLTIGGHGTRLKSISSLDKYNLYYKDKKIIDHIKNIIPDIQVVGVNKTSSRKETLKQIKQRRDVLIVDCDIIPYGFNIEHIDININNVYVFVSNKNKYSSVVLENNCISKASEYNTISNIKCSGIYFCKDLYAIIDSMEDNSIISAMNGARAILEDTFIRLGDIEDYYESLGIK